MSNSTVTLFYNRLLVRLDFSFHNNFLFVNVELKRLYLSSKVERKQFKQCNSIVHFILHLLATENFYQLHTSFHQFIIYIVVGFKIDQIKCLL